MLISLLLDEITMYYQHSALCIYGLIKNVTNSDMKYSNNTVRFMQYTKKARVAIFTVTQTKQNCMENPKEGNGCH